MNVAAATRVVVGEDHPIFREGLIRVLQGDGFEVVAAASDPRDVVRKTSAYRPDVVVVDIQMPPDRTDDGLRAALEIRACDSDVGVLVLSEFLEVRYALDLVGDRAEGVGYLLKDKVGDVACRNRFSRIGYRRLGRRPATGPTRCGRRASRLWRARR